MLAGSLSSVLKTRQFAVAPSMSAKKAPSQIASQTTRVSGLYAPSRVNTSRSYAAKSGGDLFETVLGGGEAVKDGGAAASNVLKPRIPVKREHSKPNKMRKKYKHANFLESVAHKRRVPTSMKKVWHEARAIRRLPVAKAMSFLEVYPTRSAKHLRSAVNQAKCNAVWRGFRAEDLEICTFYAAHRYACPPNGNLSDHKHLITQFNDSIIADYCLGRRLLTTFSFCSFARL